MTAVQFLSYGFIAGQSGGLYLNNRLGQGSGPFISPDLDSLYSSGVPIGPRWAAPFGQPNLPPLPLAAAKASFVRLEMAALSAWATIAP